MRPRLTALSTLELLQKLDENIGFVAGSQKIKLNNMTVFVEHLIVVCKKQKTKNVENSPKKNLRTTKVTKNFLFIVSFKNDSDESYFGFEAHHE